MTFEKVFEELCQNKKNHEEGYFNCIPFLGMQRLEAHLPGIEQATYYLITASSGVGKSKLARHLFIHTPLQFLEQENTGIKLSIKYFSLEESKKKVILSEISKYLLTKHNLNISVKQLQSIGRFNTISNDVLAKIAEAKAYVDKFLENVEIIDNIRNPTGIYKKVRDFAMQIGTYYHKDHTPFSTLEMEQLREGVDEVFKKAAYYKKHDPKHYVIILTDHISLLKPELNLTLHQTMGKYSSEYCLTMRDKWGFTVVNVQQQASDKERVEVDFRGNTIAQKLEPSLDGLGNNKETQRDATVVMGLFAPNRYALKEHNKYNIGLLKDWYRSLSILKDREGLPNKQMPLFFNGAVGSFRELPPADDSVKMDKVYKLISTI